MSTPKPEPPAPSAPVLSPKAGEPIPAASAAVSSLGASAAAGRIGLADLAAQYRALKPAIDAAVARVLASGRYVLGPEVEAFESALADYLTPAGGQRPHVIALSSGTDALLAAAMGLDLGLGCGRSVRQDLTTPDRANRSADPKVAGQGEVVTTAFSFFATPETALRLGLRPVFADLEPDGFNADVGDLLSKISPRTVALLPVHLFGLRMDVAPLVATGLPVLEDAAQTLLPGLGQTAACASLSFFPTKNLGAVGDAGAVVTCDAGLAARIIDMRQHGSRPKYVHALWGGNFRMDPLQAAILRVKLAYLDAWQAARRRHAAHYHQALALLVQAGVLRLPPSPQQAPEHVYHHFVIRAPRRDALRSFLSARGIETEVYYPQPLHLQPCLAALGYRPGSLPRSEAAAREALALPVHPELNDSQLATVSQAVCDFYRG